METEYENTSETAVEPVPIQDTFITGVDHVEFVGRSTARIWLYAIENDHRIIVGKVVMEIADIPASIATVMKATWHKLTHIPLMDSLIANRVGRH